MATIIQIRRGTNSEWTTINPILAIGEIGYVTDTNLIKAGDGVSTWTILPYFTGIPGNTGPTGPTGPTPTSYVISVNGATGEITNVAKINVGQTFSGNQGFNNDIHIVGNLIVTGQIFTYTGIIGAPTNNIVEPVDNMIMDGGEF